MDAASLPGFFTKTDYGQGIDSFHLAGRQMVLAFSVNKRQKLESTYSGTALRFTNGKTQILQWLHSMQFTSVNTEERLQTSWDNHLQAASNVEKERG